MDTGIRSMGRQLASAPPGPPLLATKLFPPRPRPDAVPRPRLLARLDAALTSPVTAIIAPAGFGKTTLLSSWLAGRRAAWLSLDPGDNDPALFAHYLVAALRRALPEIGAAVLQALAGPTETLGHRPPELRLQQRKRLLRSRHSARANHSDGARAT